MLVRSRRSVVGFRNKSGEFLGKLGGLIIKELFGRVVEVNVEVIGVGLGNLNELLSEWFVEALSFILSFWLWVGGSFKKMLGLVGIGEVDLIVGGLVGSDVVCEDGLGWGMLYV